MFRTALTTLAIALYLPCHLQADNWPCWRGPTHDGISSEEQLPIRWSQTENVLWRVPVGVGHSSPIVWEDSIFVTSCNTAQLTRQLTRIDRNSGKVIWERPIAVSPIEEMHLDNTAASGTPVTDGSRVYVVFAVENALQVAAIDFAGEVAWTRTVGNFAASHGFCTSLVLEADSLYLSGLQDGPDAFVARINKDTGDVTWKVPRAKSVRSYSTPCLCQVHGTPALLLSGAAQTIAYDRTTGKVLFEIDGPASKTGSSVVVSTELDMAYVCGGRDKQLFAIDLQNSNQSTTETPEVAAPKVAWSAKKGIPYMTSPLLTKGKLHVLSDEGIYSCFDPKTGELLSQQRAVGEVKASMVANQQHIYITETCGRTTVISNDKDWKLVAQNDLGESVVASPAISNGDIIVRGEQHLFLIRSKNEHTE